VRLPHRDHRRGYTTGVAAAAAAAGGDVVKSRAATCLVPGVLILVFFAGCGSDSKDKVAGPGPTKVEAGVPVGYERSREGAVQAALNYSEALAESLELSVDDRRGVVRAMARKDRPGFRSL